MTTERRIARIVNVPPLEPGFAGPGHTAAPVISMQEFAHTDPFIALMDDHLDMGERQVGGAHPHAGFDQVGWLDRPRGDGVSAVRLTAQQSGARLVLYAGQPQGTPIVSHGPFIGDTVDDLTRSYQEYRDGRFPRMSDIAAPARQQQVESGA